jgi:hypothetical protein
VLVSVTSDEVPTLLLRRMYLTPADTVLEVVMDADVLAVPVRLAVTVVHAKVPPVLVRASVFGLYVSAVA